MQINIQQLNQAVIILNVQSNISKSPKTQSLQNLINDFTQMASSIKPKVQKALIINFNKQDNLFFTNNKKNLLAVHIYLSFYGKYSQLGNVLLQYKQIYPYVQNVFIMQNMGQQYEPFSHYLDERSRSQIAPKRFYVSKFQEPKYQETVSKHTYYRS